MALLPPNPPPPHWRTLLIRSSWFGLLALVLLLGWLGYSRPDVLLTLYQNTIGCW